MLIEKIKEFFIRQHQTASKQRLSAEDTTRLNTMFSALEKGDTRALPSKYWIELNKMNLAQLQQHGYENFKRTIALNYFTFARILPWDTQIRFLLRNLPLRTSFRCLMNAFRHRQHNYFSAFNWIQSRLYNFLTYASWAYSRVTISEPALLALREPGEGKPAEIRDQSGELISQDLANSILEISAMGTLPSAGSVMLEVGAGYGRNAYAILAVNPKIKYVIVDIPPALWVAETYLRNQFPEHRIFQYRDFASFDEVEREFLDSDIAFFLSSQIEQLPDEFADLVITISSLHEMRIEQIEFYFAQFDRLLKDRGRFYFKQWKSGAVLFEDVVISQEDYPIPKAWHRELSREARIQTRFFEERYQKRTLLEE